MRRAIWVGGEARRVPDFYYRARQALMTLILLGGPAKAELSYFKGSGSVATSRAV